jgi:hypothetical protein
MTPDGRVSRPRPDPIEHCAVLATIKTAARRLRRCPTGSLDRHCARHTVDSQAGTEKRRAKPNR